MYLQREDAQALDRMLKEYQTIIIHRHVRPDPDAIGSQLGLKALIQARYPDKRVLAAGSNSKGLAWLGQMDQVKRSDYEEALVIVTDTANTPRLDGDYYDQGQSLIKIDHHPAVEPYGQLQLVYTQASSTSEIIASLSYVLEEELPMTAEAAFYLYAGIVGDTGRFMYNSTTAWTFEMTAWLMTYGIDAHAINDQMQLLTKEQTKFHGYVLENLSINELGVASIVITKEIMDRFQVTEEETNSAVNLASRIQGVYCWVMFVEQSSGDLKYRVRLRSKGPIVNEVASQHDGGGHPFASGANAVDDEEVQEILEELNQVTQAYLQA